MARPRKFIQTDIECTQPGCGEEPHRAGRCIHHYMAWIRSRLQRAATQSLLGPAMPAKCGLRSVLRRGPVAY